MIEHNLFYWLKSFDGGNYDRWINEITLRLIEYLMNQRSCITGIATGDQGIFMLRYAFDQVNGFSEIPLMQDIAMSTKLKGIRPPACIDQKLIVSSRKWEENGIIKTVVLMWWLRLAYFFGASPDYLAKQYYSSK